MKKKEMVFNMVCLLHLVVSDVIENCEKYGENDTITQNYSREAIGVLRTIRMTDILARSFVDRLTSDLIWFRVDLLKEHYVTLGNIIKDLPL